MMFITPIMYFDGHFFIAIEKSTISACGKKCLFDQKGKNIISNWKAIIVTEIKLRSFTFNKPLFNRNYLML